MLDDNDGDDSDLLDQIPTMFRLLNLLYETGSAGQGGLGTFQTSSWYHDAQPHLRKSRENHYRSGVFGSILEQAIAWLLSLDLKH